MNTLAYVLYLMITYLVTVHVGLVFYRNGRVYILQFFHGDAKLADFINKSLLTGYYLLNLGYAALMLRSWKTIHTWAELAAGIVSMTGRIMITLAVIHYLNMGAIWLAGRRRHQSVNNKN
jgi:hypothetical protein